MLLCTNINNLYSLGHYFTKSVIFSLFQTNFTSNHQLGQSARKINRKTTNHDLEIYFNYEPFHCMLCAEQCEPGSGVILQQCCHSVCASCLIKLIRQNSEVEIKCPYSRTSNDCKGVLLHCEIRNLIPEEEFSAFVDISVKVSHSHIICI